LHSKAVRGINRVNEPLSLPEKNADYLHMKSKRAFVVATCLICFGGLITSAGRAAHNTDFPFVHPLFSDHMVLQRGVKVPVWGWATPGAKVTVQFAGQTKSAMAQADGKWMVRLGSLSVSSEPRAIIITSSAGDRTVTIQDVLVGDVWLCSGQSNMEMGIGACTATNDIATADFPQIRLLTVPHHIATSPAQSLECRWLPCSPQTIAQGGWGGFSAAGFFFGRELYRELNTPIGLIHSSWGGTIAEAWTSTEGLRPLGDFNERLEQVAKRDRAGTYDFGAEYEKWCERNDPGTSQGWAKPEIDAAGWKTATLPQAFEQAGLPDFDGIVWFRHAFDLPAAWSGQNLKLGLGPIDDIDTTFLNGRKIGQMNRVDLNRVYEVPANLLKTGTNFIGVRVLDTGGPGGLIGKPEQMFVTLAGASETERISLAGQWQMRDSAPLAKLPSPPAVPDSNNPNIVTVLYNGMIAPLLPFAIKGAIWYQGESNAGRAKQYRRLLPAMIRDWRSRFGVGDFPFYIVQLAAFQQTQPEPRDNDWAELREAQALTGKTIPHCGLAVAIDIGEANDIHPKNKAEVGRRLALCALANTYGKKIENSGPWYKSMKMTGNNIRLEFDHLGGGLVTRGGELKGFAIAGEDRKFVWANAVIAGNKVVVSSPQVASPVAVRYAWDINPVCNLYNKTGLPAVPFRTDDWPMVTEHSK
jgi:sialate O-acetylesterase